jgi:hypothetical protein
MAGAGGSPTSELDDGEVDVDLTVTVRDASARVTSCPGEYPFDPGTMANLNDMRTGNIRCEPSTTEGTLVLRSVHLGLNPESVGVHDATALTITCTTNPPLCESIATLTVFFQSPDGGNTVQITASQADARSGTLRLDQFTDDGEVSGSLDMTLTDGEYTLHIVGRFAANLRNCGAITSTTQDPCTGQPT